MRKSMWVARTLLLALLLALCALGGAAAEVVPVDGLNMTFTLDETAGTAVFTNVENPATAMTVSVPEHIEVNGQTYAVTEIKLKYSVKNDARANVTGFLIPRTVTTVTKSKFTKFPNLQSMTIPGTVKTFHGTFTDCTQLTSLVFSDGVERIEAVNESLVKNCMLLESIYFPKDVVLANEYTDDPDLIPPTTRLNGSGLKTVTLPDTMTFIPDDMFWNCPNLTSVTCSGAITEIGYSSFSNCPALTTVDIPADSLTQILDNAFKSCTSLKNIPSLSNVTTIGKYAFNECASLVGPVDLSSVSEMGNYAFNKCAALAGSIDLSGLKQIPSYAFYNCHKLTGVVFSEELTSVGSCAFYYANFAGNLHLPESLSQIGTYAFAYCYRLNEVYIGSNLREIPAYAFISHKSGTQGPFKLIINNSESRVIMHDNAVSPSTEVVWLLEGLDNLDDTIAAGGMTLQEAVDRSSPGDTITLQKNVGLDATLNIPAGKDVTLDANGYTLVAQKAADLQNLVHVNAGAKLSLSGNLKLNGYANSGALVWSEGETVLAQQAVLENANLKTPYCGVVSVVGANAGLTIEGGAIRDNFIGAAHSGSVFVSKGGNLDIRGGLISGNRFAASFSDGSSAGVLLYGNATGEMSGGTISNNSAVRGSALTLYGTSRTEKASFVLSGNALITDNRCARVSSLSAAGAVYLLDNAELIMRGGAITKNKGGMGAGVCAIDSALQTENSGFEYSTAFLMEGGVISENVASGSGGGVYSYTNGVNLTSGQIINNRASTHGGGVYSEGNYDFYSTLQLSNALITNNLATSQGGGLWLCPSGGNKTYISDGAAIVGNHATPSGASPYAAGDDVVSNEKGLDLASLTLDDRILGGGNVVWMRDGAVSTLQPPNPNQFPITLDAPRYGEPDANPTPVTAVNYSGNIALKAIVTKDAVELAKKSARLLIAGNTARHGGGVGANGGVRIGTRAGVPLTVRKQWVDQKGNPLKTEPDVTHVQVSVYTDGYLLDTVELNAQNGWQITLSGLPDTLGELSVTEQVFGNYSGVMSYEAVRTAAGFEIVLTNTRVAAAPPQTGDMHQPLLYALLLLLSGACALWLARTGKKRLENK